MNGYLNKYRYKPFYKIVEQDYLQMPRHINMNLNYFRVFLHYQQNTELITVEDDVIFTTDWFQKLQLTREQIPHPSYLLSLYRPGPIESAAPFVEINHTDFSCSQGLFYYNIPIGELMTYVYKYGVDKYIDNIDLLMGRFLRQRDIPILATNPSLIQHIGSVTNGISGHFHQSESFRP
jgi:hypothetical protein